MDAKLKILKNSFFLTAQPLLMNVISLFVIGYIARKLGPADFGIFNFMTTFTMLFFPVAFMGINRIMIRDLAGQEDKSAYVRKVVPLRIMTIFLAVLLIIILSNVLNYEKRVIHAIYLGCGIFVFQMLAEIFTDLFHSFERMEFTALTRMVSGLLLTILSVIVLYFGFGLFELIGVYVIGQIVGFVLACTLIHRYFIKVNLKFDWFFIKEKIIEGFPFFLMSMMWFSIMRIDTLILSKRVDLSELGFYTSAILLITKLTIIPQGISNSLLPTISKLYKRKKNEEIAQIIRTFFVNIVLLALPSVIIISFFSNTIIEIIFGTHFLAAGIILQIGIWAFFFRCIAFLEFSILTAMHKQKQLLKSYIVGTCYCIIVNCILIYYFGSSGAVTAFVTTQLVLLILFTYYSNQFIHNMFPLIEFIKIVVLNVFLVVFLQLTNSFAFFLVIPVTLLLYFLGALLFGLVKKQHLVKIMKLFPVK